MDVKDYLHPLMKRGLTKAPDSVYNALINSINSPLNQAETDILRAKTNTMLEETSQDWLDYFGSYLGLMRKSQEDDDTYRKRLMRWVTTSKNTPNSIRNALADLLNKSADNIYIYEPYKDMLFYNKRDSKYNTLKYFSSSYYNYCVIDVQIDGNFPIKEVQEVINLFRPAGVLYVLTRDINSLNPDAPIVDFECFNEQAETDGDFYVGFNSRKQAIITPNLNDDINVKYPFYYSRKDSLFNQGKEYSNKGTKFNDYMTLGEYYQDYTPKDSDNFSSGRLYSKNYPLIDNDLLSANDNKGLTFNNTGFDVSNDDVDYTVKLNNNTKNNNGLYTIGNGDSLSLTIENNKQNLVKDTNTLTNNETVRCGGRIQKETFMGNAVAEQHGIWLGMEFWLPYLVKNNLVSLNTPYVYSVYIKKSSDIDLSKVTYFFNGDGFVDSLDKNKTLNDILDMQMAKVEKDTWVRIVIPFKFTTFTPPTKGKEYFGIELKQGIDSNLYYTSPMLNIGTKVMEYTSTPISYLISYQSTLNKPTVSIKGGIISSQDSNKVVVTGTSGQINVTLGNSEKNKLVSFNNLQVHQLNTGEQVNKLTKSIVYNTPSPNLYSIKKETLDSNDNRNIINYIPVEPNTDYMLTIYNKGNGVNTYGKYCTEDKAEYQQCNELPSANSTKLNNGSIVIHTPNDTKIKYLKLFIGLYDFNNISQGELQVSFSKGNQRIPYQMSDFDKYPNGVFVPEQVVSHVEAISHKYNTYPYNAEGISGVADIMHALQYHYGLSTGITPTNLVSSAYPDSYLTVKLKSVNQIADNDEVKIFIYDFKAKVWVLYHVHKLTTQYTTINLKIDDFSNIINSNGCMFYKIVSNTNVNVDYFALSFSNYELNNPPLNSYYNKG